MITNNNDLNITKRILIQSQYIITANEIITKKIENSCNFTSDNQKHNKLLRSVWIKWTWNVCVSIVCNEWLLSTHLQTRVCEVLQRFSRGPSKDHAFIGLQLGLFPYVWAFFIGRPWNTQHKLLIEFFLGERRYS